eukprot:680870-Alexandrium_andersonii.AAC.1
MGQGWADWHAPPRRHAIHLLRALAWPGTQSSARAVLLEDAQWSGRKKKLGREGGERASPTSLAPHLL